MGHPLEQAVYAQLSAWDFQPGGRLLLVAVSGGPDSMALANACYQLGYTIELAHVNYGRRGQAAEADTALVKHWAAERGLSCHTCRRDADTVASQQGLSFQAAARQVRYVWLEALQAARAAAAILTAHHRQDQVETLLYNLLRSQDPWVLKGIPAQRGGIYRPLLATAPALIEAYLQQAQIPYREDASNADTSYLRNYIRHELLPQLAAVNPAYEDQLLERWARYQHQLGLLRQQATEALTPTPRGYWLAAPGKPDEGLQQEALALQLYEQLGLNRGEREAVLALIAAQRGKQAKLRNWQVLRERAGLMFRPLSEAAPATKGPHAMTFADLPLATSWGAAQLRLEVQSVASEGRALETAARSDDATALMDADAIQPPLLLRRWQAGDRMQPLGMTGTKKLKQLLGETALNAGEKANAFVLADQAGILYAQGARIAERARVTRATGRLLVVTLSDA
jgi:tRNA(Ile)-lysidine synthase